MERIAQASPRLMGRLVAVCYFVITAAGFDIFFVLRKLVVRGDAAATATNILSHEALFLAGSAVALLGVAAALGVTALWYRLFEPVSRTVSLSAALFSLTGCTIQASGLVFHLAPLVVLANQPYLAAFKPEQSQALALVFLNTYGYAYNLSLVFFGFYLLQIGYLTFRSTFLPRWLGVIVALGVGWVTFLYPPLARALSPYIILSSVGEFLLVVWLLVKGVDEKRWYEQAAGMAV
jgi:hypothetical protein